MKAAILALCCVALAFASNDVDVIRDAEQYFLRETSAPKGLFAVKPELATEDHFNEFVHRYGKQYRDEVERGLKFHTFRVNMLIAATLEKFDLGSARYGATEFADVTSEEFKRTHRNVISDPSFMSAVAAEIPASFNAPTSVDWRQKGAVTPVKNQQQCGSCWAFSTTGNIEGQWFLKKGQLISLSEQELVDCDKVDQGCGGGLPTNAYQVIINTLGGLVPESDYPYTAKDGTCHLTKSEIAVTINGYVNISQDESQMATWCAANGPISIGINAAAMQLYMGGIAHPWKIFCNPEKLDHGVLIVGYAVKGSEPYWIVKNSWGASWGVEGYYLVYRGDGVCGLNRMCSSAVVH